MLTHYAADEQIEFAACLGAALWTFVAERPPDTPPIQGIAAWD